MLIRNMYMFIYDVRCTCTCILVYTYVTHIMTTMIHAPCVIILYTRMTYDYPMVVM